MKNIVLLLLLLFTKSNIANATTPSIHETLEVISHIDDNYTINFHNISTRNDDGSDATCTLKTNNNKFSNRTNKYELDKEHNYIILAKNLKINTPRNYLNIHGHPSIMIHSLSGRPFWVFDNCRSKERWPEPDWCNTTYLEFVFPNNNTGMHKKMYNALKHYIESCKAQVKALDEF